MNKNFNYKIYFIDLLKKKVVLMDKKRMLSRIREKFSSGFKMNYFKLLNLN